MRTGSLSRVCLREPVADTGPARLAASPVLPGTREKALPSHLLYGG